MESKTKEQLIQQAVRSFAGQQKDQAEQYLLQAIELEPGAIDCRYHLANLYSDLRRYADAASCLEPVKGDERIQPHYLWFEFQRLWAEGELEEAYTVLQQALPGRKCNDHDLKQLTDFAFQGGYARLFIHLTKQTGQYQEQNDLKWIEILYGLLRWIPASSWRNELQLWIDAYTRQNRFRRLRVLLTAAALADPDHAAWKVQLGQYYRRSRDIYDPRFLREKGLYETALKMDPQNVEAQNGLLYTLYDMRAWHDLHHVFSECNQSTLTDSQLLMAAACETHLGLYEEAKQRYIRFMKKYPKTVQSDYIRFYLGLIALEEHDDDAVKEYFSHEAQQRGLQNLNRFFLYWVTHEPERLWNSTAGQEALDSLSLTIPKGDQEIHAPLADACFLCGWDGERAPLWQDTRSGWVRARCPQCTMISVAPIPPLEAILALYQQPKGQEKSLYRIARDEVKDLQRSNETLCRNLPLYSHFTQWGNEFSWEAFEASLGAEKYFLDVGCSAGKTVLLFQQCGWKAMGIDVDQDAIAFAQEHGLRVKRMTTSELVKSGAQFDFITLTDVIEHVQDPSRLVEEVHRLLKPGGLLFVKTPCLDSLPHYFLGDRLLESCEHLHFFSRKTLKQTLEQQGFSVLGIKQPMEEMTPFMHFQYWNHKFIPILLEQWITRLQVGDTISMLARKQ